LIQLTIIRIEGYGPWTITLGSDREAHIQMLQARVYYDLQRVFSEHGCLVFSNRFDEYFAITNGLAANDHVTIGCELAKLYNNLKLSIAIGRGATAFEANLKAHKARKDAKATGNATGSSKSETLVFGNGLTNGLRKDDDDAGDNMVQLMHIDVDSSTKISSRLSPYEITYLVSKIYAKLSEAFLKESSLTFFLGGDNFMVISNGVTKDEAIKIITGKTVTQDLDIKLNCGIGVGRNAKTAAAAATEALDTIRSLRNKGRIQSVYEIRCL